MLITGLISILSIGDFDFLGFLGVVLYGVLANVFYCLGFFLEVAAQYYLKSEKDFKQPRAAIFWIGLVFSVVLTIWAGITSYTVVPD